MSEKLDKMLEDSELDVEIKEMIAIGIAEGIQKSKDETSGEKDKGKKKIPEPSCFGKYPARSEVKRKCRTCRYAQECRDKSKVGRSGANAKKKHKV